MTGTESEKQVQRKKHHDTSWAGGWDWAGSWEQLAFGEEECGRKSELTRPTRAQMWPSWEREPCGTGKGAEEMVVALYFSVSSGPSAVILISYSSLGNIINATFFGKVNEEDRVYLNSQLLSAAIGPKRNTSLSRPVILSFRHLKVGRACYLGLLGFHRRRWNKRIASQSVILDLCCPIS